MSLDRLIAEAVVLAGGEHACDKLGHVWQSIGGRACPFHEDGCGDSQAAEECGSCGLMDYGTAAGFPGYEYCARQGFNCGRGADENLVARAQSRHDADFRARAMAHIVSQHAPDPNNPPSGGSQREV
jgi:hypothetical protein